MCKNVPILTMRKDSVKLFIGEVKIAFRSGNSKTKYTILFK